MFIWLFHRISGVVLLVLLGIKIFTSYFLMTKAQKPELALALHTHAVSDILIIVLFTFHSLYGVRTIIMDFGFRQEKLMFWGSTLLAACISAILVTVYFLQG